MTLDAYLCPLLEQPLCLPYSPSFSPCSSILSVSRTPSELPAVRYKSLKLCRTSLFMSTILFTLTTLCVNLSLFYELFLFKKIIIMHIILIEIIIIIKTMIIIIALIRIIIIVLLLLGPAQGEHYYFPHCPSVCAFVRL